MWLSSMCSMSSARVGKWSPQPPNLQALEKKEAAAMPVMVLHRDPPAVPALPGPAAAGRGEAGARGERDGAREMGSERDVGGGEEEEEEVVVVEAVVVQATRVRVPSVLVEVEEEEEVVPATRVKCPSALEVAA